LQAGGNINEFQAKTFSRIQLSKSGEYYPGTTERTLLVSGGLKQIIAALGLVFAKLQREGVAPVTPRTKTVMDTRDSSEPESADSPSDHPVHLAIKLLVPQPLCGIIIGKLGATVKAYAADTQTQIRVTAPDGPAAGLNHRIVTINGATDNCLKAIALLVLKQTEDPKFQMYSELPSSYSSGGIAIPGGVQYNGSPYVLTPQSVHAMQHMGYQSYIAGGGGVNGGGMSSAGTSPPTSAMYASAGAAAAVNGNSGHMYTNGMDGLATMTFPLPDDQATIVLGSGRGSGGIEDVQAAAGVRIKIELGGEKGISATQHQPNIAHITVIGSPENVQYANFLMAQRLSSLMMMMHQQHQQYAMAAANHANGTTYYHHQHHSYGRPQHHHGYGNGNSHGTNNGYNNGHHYYNSSGTNGGTGGGGGGGANGMESENGSRRPSPRTVMAAHLRGSNGSAAGER
jgi:RNA-binding protein Nova